MGNNFTTTSAAAGSGMTLTQARERIRHFARDAAGDDSAYADADVDYVLAAAGERFCRETRCLRTADDVSLTSGDAAADFSGLDGFTPERIVDLRITGEAEPLERPDWDELKRRQVDEAGDGVPTALAFETPTGAEVHPTPDDDYTLRVRWWQPFTTWTAGVDEATADAIVLNLRPEYLNRLLPFAAGLLQVNEPDQVFARPSWQEFKADVIALSGAGSLGQRTSRRGMADWG